jgi:hypothetical protein
MKIKKTTFVFPVLVICAVFTMVSCEGEMPVDTPSNTDPKSIVIVGVDQPYISEQATIAVAEFQAGELALIALGSVDQTTNTTTFPLLDKKYTNPSRVWTGTGDYVIVLYIGEPTESQAFVFSDKTLEELIDGEELNWPHYRISQRVSTIGFNEFINISDYLNE